MHSQVCDRCTDGTGEGLDQSWNSIFSQSVLVRIDVFSVFVPVSVRAVFVFVASMYAMLVCGAAPMAVGKMSIMCITAMFDNLCASKQYISFLLFAFIN